MKMLMMMMTMMWIHVCRVLLWAIWFTCSQVKSRLMGWRQRNPESLKLLARGHLEQSIFGGKVLKCA